MSKLTRRGFVSSAAVAALAAVSANVALADEKDPFVFEDADVVEIADDTTITVAASPTPHAVILNGPVKELLEAQGYTLEVVEFTDYVLPNTVVEDGEIDANYFQHTPYLESFNEENGTHLVPVAWVHYEPFGIYPGRVESIDALTDGAKIAVPNDTTNEARALLLLEQEGLISINPEAGITATVNDIEDNPLNLEFVELEAANIPNILPDVALACINGNYALDAGYTVADALAIESADGIAAQTYGNILVVHAGNEEVAKVQALAEALLSPEVAQFIVDTFDGAVQPMVAGEGEAAEGGAYADGTYEAAKNGIGGKVPVTVTVEGGVITSVEVGDNAETAGIGTKAIEALPAAIVEANGVEGVDAVSGATVTSNAILKGVEEALAAAQA